MNKHEEYQEALDFYWKVYEEHHLGMLARHYIDILKELVDKETPKKVIIKKYGDFNIGDYYCPHCNQQINEEFEPKYCKDCGKALDWS